jgi:hypothetical protein
MVLFLCGLPRVGKDEFVKAIRNEYDIKSYSFALPIKEMCCAAFGWKLEDFENDNKEIIDPYWGISMRQAMEFIGTETMRKSIRKLFPLFDNLIGEEIWVKRFEKFYLENKDKNIIVTDLRYIPEYEFYKTLTCFKKIIYIERPNCDKTRNYDIDSFEKDNYIYNNQSLTIYHSTVLEFYKQFLKESQEWKL